MRGDAIGEIELEAYLDGELDLPHRLAIESFLAVRPAAAAAMMEAMRARSALRVLNAEPVDRSGFAATGARLSRALADGAPRRRMAVWPIMAAAAAGATSMIGGALVVLPGSSAVARQPAFIEDAAISYQTGRLRAAMASQPEVRQLDQAEIQRAIRIHIPRLPAGWDVTDVQIFPADDGPALQLMIRTADRQSISLFAVRGQDAAPLTPVAVRQGGTSVAYWRKGDISYAIAGMQSPETLDRIADDFAAGKVI